MKLEINHKKNTEEHTKTWKPNNMLLNNEWVNNEIIDEIKRYLETNEHEVTTIQNLCKPKRDIHSITSLLEKIKKKLK